MKTHIYFSLFLFASMAISGLSLLFSRESVNYEWNELRSNSTFVPGPGQQWASSITGIPVFASMAAISIRLDNLSLVIESIFKNRILPSRLYVFVSKEPYLLDRGIPTIPSTLSQLMNTFPVSFVYTNNTGPHRKLLPLLWKKWFDDAIIITVDDDVQPPKDMIGQLIKYYKASNGIGIVSLRSRRIGLCINSPGKFLTYQRWAVSRHGSVEFLQMPTGTGGILYKPSFFHPIVFDATLRNITGTADDLMFRISTMVNYVPVVLACRDVFHDKKWYRCPSKISSLQNLKYFAHNTTINSVRNSSVAMNDLRQLLNYKNPALSTETLFEINRRQNDIQWRKAITYLDVLGLWNSSVMFSANRWPYDRPAVCYNASTINSSRYKFMCSINVC